MTMARCDFDRFRCDRYAEMERNTIHTRLELGITTHYSRQVALISAARTFGQQDYQGHFAKSLPPLRAYRNKKQKQMIARTSATRPTGNIALLFRQPVRRILFTVYLLIGKELYHFLRAEVNMTIVFSEFSSTRQSVLLCGAVVAGATRARCCCAVWCSLPAGWASMTSLVQQQSTMLGFGGYMYRIGLD
jgi:hypothetical protein